MRAVAAILESLPPGAAGKALIEVSSADNRQVLIRPDGAQVEWVIREGDRDGCALLDAVKRAVIPPAPVYAWVAAGNAATVEIGKHLRKEFGLPAMSVCAISYW